MVQLVAYKYESHISVIAKNIPAGAAGVVDTPEHSRCHEGPTVKHLHPTPAVQWLTEELRHSTHEQMERFKCGCLNPTLADLKLEAWYKFLGELNCPCQGPASLYRQVKDSSCPTYTGLQSIKYLKQDQVNAVWNLYI